MYSRAYSMLRFSSMTTTTWFDRMGDPRSFCGLASPSAAKAERVAEFASCAANSPARQRVLIANDSNLRRDIRTPGGCRLVILPAMPNTTQHEVAAPTPTSRLGGSFAVPNRERGAEMEEHREQSSRVPYDAARVS